MPTVSNHDVLGPMTWGAGGNVRHFNARLGDRSDARGGINSLLFGEASGNGSPCAPAGPTHLQQLVPQEHAYATGLASGATQVLRPNSFVTQNGYYGYQHPTASTAVASHEAEGMGQDCSMDISENNLPDHAFGLHPSVGGAFGFGAHHGPAAQHVWHADPINRNQFPLQTRKRNFEARGPAASEDVLDHDLSERSTKRTKSCPCDQSELGASTHAMAPCFEVPSSTPSIAEQIQSPVQMYDLPTQKLPRTTSQLADAMTPRPRCLMGHFI